MIYRNTTRDLKRPSYMPEDCWEATVRNWEKIEAKMEDFELPSEQQRWAILIGYGMGYKDARRIRLANPKRPGLNQMSSMRQ